MHTGGSMPENNKVHNLIAGRIQSEHTLKPEQAGAASLEPLLAEIKDRHGDALLAILVYGSWLRGKRDTMLDFYVLLEDYRTLGSSWQAWMCRLLPPNVYHIHYRKDDSADGIEELRAKYALLSLGRFQRAMWHDFHSYFWARFAQPCECLYVRDAATRTILARTFTRAATTFIHRVLPTLPSQFSSKELWTRGLSLTYRCELRTESSHHAASLYEFNLDWYDSITTAMALDHAKFSSSGEDSGSYLNHSATLDRKLAPLSWWLRRLQGKLLSSFRLFKAAFTFNEPLLYLLWKIEHHTGLRIEPSTRQINHPLIFAWPLLWKLYRRGAFR